MLDQVDLVLVMTVNPGFGGQVHPGDGRQDPRAPRHDRRAAHRHLQVDGGIAPSTAGACAEAGANVLVAGSAVFQNGRYRDNIAAIRAAAVKGSDPSPPPKEA